MEDAVAPLAADDRASARLALLAALAPSQVDADVLDEFRRAHPTDPALIAAAGWASFTAMRRIGTWLAPPD
jgi:hypothetical protein